MMSRTREAEIWARVLQENGVPTQTNIENSSGGLTSSALELIRQERQESAVYSMLAARARGGRRSAFLQLAQQARARSRRLEALYYLMEGRKPCSDQSRKPCMTCPAELLRALYHQAVARTGQYRNLAAQAGTYAQSLYCLADETDRLGCTLLRLLEQCL